MDEEQEFIVMQSIRSIREWKAHILRCVNQDQAWEVILDKMGDKELLLENGWAMKFLPLLFRESHSNWIAQ